MLLGVWAGFYLILGNGGAEGCSRFRLSWVQKENTSQVYVLFLITLNSVLFFYCKNQAYRVGKEFFLIKAKDRGNNSVQDSSMHVIMSFSVPAF